MREFINKNLFLIIIVLGFLFLLSLPNKAYAQAPLCRAAPGQIYTGSKYIKQCDCSTPSQNYTCDNRNGACISRAPFTGASTTCGAPGNGCRNIPVSPLSHTELCLQGESGGDSGGSGITCPETGFLGDGGWIYNPIGTHSKDAIVPVAYKAVLNDGLVGSVSIEFGRYGWQNPVRETACECWRQNGGSGYICTNGCYILGPNPTGGRRAVVQIAHNNVIDLMRQVMWSRSRSSNILDGWAVRIYACSINTNPNVDSDCSIYWPRCHTTVNVTITDCTPSSCPATPCTVTNAQCATANSGDIEYKATSSGGALCKGNNASCTNSDGCGGTIVCNTSTCYKPETNTTPNPPQDLQITIDEVNSGNLSTVASSPPTLIKYPYPSSAISTFIRNVTSAPAGSREFGWELRIGSTLITPRKVFNTAPPFNVYGPYPSASSLFQGYNGVYHARYYTLNKCDNIEKYSTSLDGYFRVNTLPTSTGTIIGEANPDYKGCVPEAKYTGKHVNRTLTVTVSGSDPDDTNSINGAILWLVKDGSNITNEKGLMTFVGPSNARVDINKIGLFINSGGTVYISDNSTGTLTGWGRNGRDGGTIPHPVTDGNDVTIIDNVQLVRHGMNLLNGRYEYEITLAFPESSPLTGHYTLYTGMTDTLSYVQDSLGRTSIDQRKVSSTGPDWNFDFVSPRITNTDTDINNNTRILTLKWDSQDDWSGIRDNYTVVNAYKDSNPQSITWITTPNKEIEYPVSSPQAPYIGDYNPLVSGWLYPSSGTSRSMDISTGQNTSGDLSFFITAYDKACNFGQNSPLAINLNKWVNTKGGVFYSKGIVAYATKPIEDDFYNLGTELISSNSNSIGLVRIYTPPNLHVNPAVAKNIVDINNNSGQYAKLKENFERKKGNLPSADDNGGTVTCSFDTGCIWETSTIGNTSYSGKIIAYSDSDIKIEGEIKNNAVGANTNKDGLIIFSEGTITITGETGTSSELKLKTDRIDAWLLAKNNVIIEPGTGENTKEPYYYHDQVHVTGGIVAFGEGGSTPAFQLKRTLGLFNISDPVLKVDYHPKYSSLSELFFGLHNPAYKREVGFKPM